MKKNTIPLIVKSGFTIIALILPFIPFAEVFIPENDCLHFDCWQTQTIINDNVSLLIYLPYLGICIFYLWTERFKWIRYLLISGTLLLFANTGMGIMGGGQDFSPAYGMAVLLLFLLAFLYYLIFKNSLLKS